MSTEATYVIYADDTSLFFSAQDKEKLAQVANHTLDSLHKWSSVNSLPVNTSKTKAVLFKPKNKSMVFDYNLVLGPSIIEIVPSTKTLGVIFQENLSWDFHIEGLIRKISKAVGILNRFRFDLPVKIKLLLYNSLFSSHLNYCHLVWGTTTLTNINNLHVFKKNAIRSIVNSSYENHMKN